MHKHQKYGSLKIHVPRVIGQRKSPVKTYTTPLPVKSFYSKRWRSTTHSNECLDKTSSLLTDRGQVLIDISITRPSVAMLICPHHSWILIQKLIAQLNAHHISFYNTQARWTAWRANAFSSPFATHILQRIVNWQLRHARFTSTTGISVCQCPFHTPRPRCYLVSRQFRPIVDNYPWRSRIFLHDLATVQS